MPQYYEAHAAAFVELLTGDVNATLHFQLFYDPKDGSKRRDLATHFPANLKQAQGAIERAETNQQGVYVCINETDRRGRDVNNITKVRTLFADFDNQAEPDWPLPPHFVTKRDDTHGHAFWLVDDVAVDDFMFLQRRIAMSCSTDLQVIDPSRVCRLPGTLHLKDPQNPKMYYLAVNNGLQSKYTSQQITDAFTLNTEDAEKYQQWCDSRNSLDTGTGFNENHVYRHRLVKFLTEHAPVAAKGFGRSHTVIKVMSFAYDHGIPLEEAIEIGWQHYNPRIEPPYTDEEYENKWRTYVTRAYKYAKNEPGCRTASAAFSEAIAIPPIPVREVKELILRGDRKSKKVIELVKGMYNAKTPHYELAQGFDGEVYEGCKIIRSNKQFYDYDGKKWNLLEDSYVKSMIQRYLSTFKPNDTLVNGVYKSLSDLINVRCVQDGTWLDSNTPADTVISFKNGLVDMKDNHAKVIDHTPDLFNFTSLGYDYDPSAVCPNWEQFLNEIFEFDTDLVLQMQEWFGYCLSNDTSMQKFGLFIGQPRAGKGVITTILSALVGSDNTSAPTLSKLTNDSTLHDLSTKSLALIPDAHSVNVNLRDSVLSNFKAMTGGDPVSYHVMYKGTQTSVFKIKFLMSTNNMPEFNDPSGALAARMLVFPFKKSFVGKEDFNLAARLGGELAGIAQWAIEGYRRLKRQNGFTQAESGLKSKAILKYDMNPLSEFIEMHCVQDEKAFTGKQELYNVYLAWCKQVSQHSPLSAQRFTRLINSSGMNIEHDRRYTDSGRVWGWRGVALNNAFIHAEALPVLDSE